MYNFRHLSTAFETTAQIRRNVMPEGAANTAREDMYLNKSCPFVQTSSSYLHVDSVNIVSLSAINTDLRSTPLHLVFIFR
jgi:hypothetical protein